MNQVLFYLAQVITASGLLYAYYHFALRNKKFHRYNRFYLLMAVVISSFIPFLNIPVYFSQKEAASSVVLQTLQVISSPSLSVDNSSVLTAVQTEQVGTPLFTTENFITLFYLFVLSFFLLRLLVSLNKIKILIKRNTIEQLDKIKFVNTDEPGTPFSFFRWLFWNRKIELHSDKGEQIFRHELFHIQQKHSWDIIFMELVSTIFWINPFFHLIKKELKAIHEFLADEFAITENKNWQYAELLLMQALNTNNQLVNPFFHNQIKRRIAMITTSQKPSFRYLRKIMVLPVAAAIILLFAFNYKNKQSDPHEFEKAINSITVVIDAGHGGTDKGAKTKDGKYNEAELSLAIAKKIEALGREYNINVIMTRQDEKFPEGSINKNQALRKRIEMVNNLKPHAFIAIHMNTTSENGQVSKSGFDAYITNQRYNYPDIQLASSVLGELRKIYTTREEIKQRGNATIYVIDESNAPSLLLECGFINNPKDLSFVTNAKNQEKIARAILKGLVAFANNSTSKTNPGINATNVFAFSDTTTPGSSPRNDLKKALVVIDGVIQSERGFYSIDSNLIVKSKIEELRVFTDKTAIEKYGEKGRDGVIEIDTKENGKRAVDTIPKVDTVFWIKDMPAPAKQSPTTSELNSWCDEKMYGVWIDGTRVRNSELINHKPSEFSWYNVSKLAKNAVNYGKHYYQVSLYTKNYVDKQKNLSNSIRDVVLKQIALGDTSTSSQKRPMDTIPKVIVKEVTLQPKPTVDHDNKVFVKVQVEPSFPGGEKEWTKYLDRNLDVNIPLKNKCKPGSYTVIIQFIVDREGNPVDLRPLTNHGFGMEDHVINVIKKGPRWIPGLQNGRAVKAYKKQPVTFVIGGGIKNAPLSSNSFDPPPISRDDPDFSRKWREMIAEVKAMAWKEGKAGYVHKGRTYVFGRIVNPDSTVASFTEQNGTNHVFLLNDELINSIDELNNLIKRSDVKRFGFIKPEEAWNRFNRKDPVVFIETYDEVITRN